MIFCHLFSLLICFFNLEAKAGMIRAGFMKGKWTNDPSQEVFGPEYQGRVCWCQNLSSDGSKAELNRWVGGGLASNEGSCANPLPQSYRGALGWGPRLFSTWMRDQRVLEHRQPQIGRRRWNQRPGGVAIRVGGCVPDRSLGKLGGRCVVDGAVDICWPHSNQARRAFSRATSPCKLAWRCSSRGTPADLRRGNCGCAFFASTLLEGGLSPDGAGP